MENNNFVHNSHLSGQVFGPSFVVMQHRLQSQKRLLPDPQQSVSHSMSVLFLKISALNPYYQLNLSVAFLWNLFHQFLVLRLPDDYN